MTSTEILMIAATALSPLIAVQVTKWLEGKKEAKDRRLYVFRTLMSTRAQRLSVAHVQALNLIDINFDGSGPLDSAVITAWREYLDQLSTGDPTATTWGQRNDDLFARLMVAMGRAVGYRFDAVHIKRGAYIPTAHARIDEEQAQFRAAMLALLKGETSLRVRRGESDAEHI